MPETSKEIAFCGLICQLDDCYAQCGGCKKGDGCGDQDCYHKKCCRKRGLAGCWECADFPCGQGYFNPERKSAGQFTGCVKYIRETRLEDYAAAVERNIQCGIKYGLNGEYGTKTEAEVLAMLRKSRKKPL